MEKLINGRYVWSEKHEELAKIINAEEKKATLLNNDEEVILDLENCSEPTAEQLTEADVEQPAEMTTETAAAVTTGE